MYVKRRSDWRKGLESGVTNTQCSAVFVKFHPRFVKIAFGGLAGMLLKMPDVA